AWGPKAALFGAQVDSARTALSELTRTALFELTIDGCALSVFFKEVKTHPDRSAGLVILARSGFVLANPIIRNLDKARTFRAHPSFEYGDGLVIHPISPCRALKSTLTNRR